MTGASVRMWSQYTMSPSMVGLGGVDGTERDY